MPAFFLYLNECIIDLFRRRSLRPINAVRFGRRCWMGHIATGLRLVLCERPGRNRSGLEFGLRDGTQSFAHGENPFRDKVCPHTGSAWRSRAS